MKKYLAERSTLLWVFAEQGSSGDGCAVAHRMVCIISLWDICYADPDPWYRDSRMFSHRLCQASFHELISQHGFREAAVALIRAIETLILFLEF